MSGEYFLKKLFAGAATIALGTSFASIGAPQAHAATATKTAPLSCRTNGAPMGYNVTRDMHTRLVVSGPDHVKAGHNTVVRVQYLPDVAPGTESIATMETLHDIVVRFTLNDPSSFVTARAVNAGQNLTKQPQISLVGGNTLVLSGMTVNVNGHDTHWAPPALELTFTAPTDGDPLKTLHLAVEGAAGKFNNPANAMTMRARTRSELGETTVQMNCQARSDASSVLTIPVTGAKDSSSPPPSPTTLRAPPTRVTALPPAKTATTVANTAPPARTAAREPQTHTTPVAAKVTAPAQLPATPLPPTPAPPPPTALPRHLTASSVWTATCTPKTSHP